MAHTCPKCFGTITTSKGVGRRTCTQCRHHFRIATKREQLREASKDAVFTETRYVVTSAVNETPVHPAFWKSLRSYCVANKARLIVVPLRYKNPTSRGEAVNQDQEDTWYAPEVVPYLYLGRAQLCANLTLVADVATQPTASRSLNGLATFGGKSARDSVIFAHPRVAMETVPTQAGRLAKWAVTTGACTEATYSDTNAGAKGEFHHAFAALNVEVDGDKFHIRHLNASSKHGYFYDLDKVYDGDFIGPATAKVLTCGDVHAVRADPAALDATFFAEDSMLAVLKPAHVVLHDLLDFQCASHHNDWITKFRLFHEGKASVLGELKATFALVERMIHAAPEYTQFYCVDSNHPRHFNRWLNGTAGADDMLNALEFHETKVAWMRAVLEKRAFSPFTWWADRLMSPETRARITFLDANDSLTFDGVEYAAHGDIGPNGARGSREGFTKVGTKMVIGHSHSPGITDGVVQVGTLSDLDLGYNKAFSGWLHTNCVSDQLGKRVLLTAVNGVWKGGGK